MKDWLLMVGVTIISFLLLVIVIIGVYTSGLVVTYKEVSIFVTLIAIVSVVVFILLELLGVIKYEIKRRKRKQ